MVYNFWMLQIVIGFILIMLTSSTYVVSGMKYPLQNDSIIKLSPDGTYIAKANENLSVIIEK